MTADHFSSNQFVTAVCQLRKMYLLYHSNELH